MVTVAQLLARSGELRDVAASYRLDTELLLCRVLARDRAFLYARPETELTDAQAREFDYLFARRKGGEPMAYILGEREFWTLRLKVSPATLIPRPETELLVELALALVAEPAARVLDLGTGSGAIALALARERPAWQVTGIDSSAAALAVAEENRAALGLGNVQLRRRDWFDGDADRYDLIVANPPYIDADDPHLARGDVRFEPRAALVAAAAGMAALRAIIAQAPSHLGPGGWLLLEHGSTQGAAVRECCAGALQEVRTWRDPAGCERVTGGRMA